MNMPERLRLRAAAAAITLLSGAVMMLAGYVGHAETWTAAGFITIPGGILILAAFVLARRADGADGQKYLGEKNEALRSMSVLNGEPAAYVCENFTCKAPVTDPDDLRKLLTTSR